MTCVACPENAASGSESETITPRLFQSRKRRGCLVVDMLHASMLTVSDSESISDKTMPCTANFSDFYVSRVSAAN